MSRWSAFRNAALVSAVIVLLTGWSGLAQALAPGGAVLTAIQAVLAHGTPDARASALEWVARDPQVQVVALQPTIFAALQDAQAAVRDRALANLGWIYARDPAAPAGQRAMAAIGTALRQKRDRAVRLTAVDLLRAAAGTPDGPLLQQPAMQHQVAVLLADPLSALRSDLLPVVQASSGLQRNPEVVAALGRSLDDDSLSVRSDSADLLLVILHAGDPALASRIRPLLLRALATNDPNVQLRISKAMGLPVPPALAAPAVLSLSGEQLATGDVPFDFNYYTAFVQPLFVKKYNHEACVDCHTPTSRTVGKFHLLPPDAAGRYTLAQSRINFVSLMSAIDRSHPEQSPLLLKPLDPRASEGRQRGLTHDGGVAWSTALDPDFQLVRDWLRGAKLETTPEKQRDYALFAANVERVFSTPGPDGFACINCHSTHAILHLESPATRDGQVSVEQLRNNYEAAHRVIDTAAPGDSFIVRKPTSLREGEPGGLSHAGGIRWPEKKDSWQYKTLLGWIAQPNLAAP